MKQGLLSNPYKIRCFDTNPTSTHRRLWIPSKPLPSVYPRSARQHPHFLRTNSKHIWW